MRLTVNGEAREMPEGLTVRDLLGRLFLPPGRVACEVNGVVVRRGEHGSRVLADGDVVEIVRMIGGG